MFTQRSSDIFLDYIFLRFNYFFVIYYLGEYFQFLVTRSGYVETNPGPKKQAHLKFFHWSLNGPAANNFAKVPLLEVLTKRFHFDIVCLSEAFFGIMCSLKDPLYCDNKRVGVYKY